MRFTAGPARLVGAIVLVVLAAVPAASGRADAGRYIELERVIAFSGLPAEERVFVGRATEGFASNDLLIRCWNAHSSDWYRFAGRFGGYDCRHRGNCKFIQLFRAFISGAGAVAELLKSGDEGDALAVMALFAAEPAMVARLLNDLPPAVADTARARFEPLTWLWEAVRSENVFLALAHEHALDRPYRGDRQATLQIEGETDPFLTVGRSLSFSQPEALECTILTYEKQAFAGGQPRDPRACPTAFALFEMANIRPADSVVDAYQRVILGLCSSKFDGTRFIGDDSLRCCGFFAIQVVLAATDEVAPNHFPSDRRRFARLRHESRTVEATASSPPSAGSLQPGAPAAPPPSHR